MDLLRAALGLHRGSARMAEVFKKEALKRIEELEGQSSNPYIDMLVNKTRIVLESDRERTAEDLLMYSILFRNFVQKIEVDKLFV
ncbi:MAG: hypothetical protein A3D24_01345 [Candidatus Blackburnbacteria bacterium RIFCSPHIGHO2_02_FULL_39_13]|uniref:Uncharacterized protein n=1 Tax=Candidatus Blackburnbacteria bacterium RIFCSPLOWO2_01_FULL_40_20 TaxID=1797519 RepID=A0A1G1VFC2_9BACT|nr:MAG: hypothetical protein A2694_00450 [Candidatus Blackburnbacteria bacterium RIFCSPHIGHO2_01_FULL_40_17]OGY09789.1 MAG: hypothetical protein A3D24_01345 [Candidatus Blackburnbacteria bacterium RIFCSPHIGHO2_02_FULL_39_13]OGY14069.1 MAG: hypothetical protein A3A77_03790 [Candidatus Blackburnbacteria bacterium RIFCSPLOWO2_01_FULL_40_20]HBL52271.1 hypothetical protein [Candidatus Blackburnbacteria bacterium]